MLRSLLMPMADSSSSGNGDIGSGACRWVVCVAWLTKNVPTSSTSMSQSDGSCAKMCATNLHHSPSIKQQAHGRQFHKYEPVLSEIDPSCALKHLTDVVRGAIGCEVLQPALGERAGTGPVVLGSAPPPNAAHADAQRDGRAPMSGLCGVIDEVQEARVVDGHRPVLGQLQQPLQKMHAIAKVILNRICQKFLLQLEMALGPLGSNA